MAKSTKLSGQPVLCQILSFLPRDLVHICVEEHKSDRYYKTMTTYKQLVFILYGVVTKCNSLNNLCKNLLFLENKLTYLGIYELPAVSTLSDANKNRNSEVFASIYSRLYEYYKSRISPIYCCLLADKVDASKVCLIDSSSITLFTDIFKGAGRNTITGKKKVG